MKGRSNQNTLGMIRQAALVEGLELRRLLCSLPLHHLPEAPKWSDAIEQEFASQQDGGPEAVSLVWTNRETFTGTDDNRFDDVFGTSAPAAQAVVDAALRAWERVITSFNRSDGSSTLQIAIRMATDPDTGALVPGFGASGAPANVAPADGKPRTGRISLQAGTINADPNDSNGWFLDATPDDNSEFLGSILNPFTANPTTVVGSDLYSVVAAEVMHVLGLISPQPDDPDGRWINYLLIESGLTRPTFQRDNAEGGGNFGFFYTFDGPTVDHLMTSYNSGDGDSDSWGNVIHTAGGTANINFLGRNWRGTDDPGNAFYASERTLPSWVTAHILADAYGYSIENPAKFGTMHAVLSHSTGQLRIRGLDNSDDVINVRNESGRLVVSVDLGNDVPGTGADPGPGNLPAWVSEFASADVDSILIEGGSGNDIIQVDSTTGEWVTVRGGLGDDRIELGNGNLGPAVSSVRVVGDGGDDVLILDDRFSTHDLPWAVYGNTGDPNTINTVFLGLNAYTYVDTERVEAWGGGGNNDFQVHSATTAVVLIGNGGNDQFRFLQNGGPITDTMQVYGESGFDALSFDDRTSNPTAAEIHADRVVRVFGTFPTSFETTVTYGGIENPTYQGGNSTTDIRIYGTPASIPAGFQWNVGGGSNGDTVTLYPRDAQGNLTINGNIGISPGAGSDQFVVNDASSSLPINYRFTNPFGPGGTTINGMGASHVNLGDDFENITVHAGTGSDRFDLETYHSISAIRLNGGGGDDALHVAGPSQRLDTSMRHSAAPVFDGGAGNDLAIVHNTADSAGSTYSVRSAFVSASKAAHSFTLNHSNAEVVEVRAGAGADTYNIASVAAGMTYHLRGGAGADSFLAGNLMLVNEIFGGVRIDAGGNNSDGLVIDDRNDPIGRTFHVTKDGFIGAAPGDDLFPGDGFVQFDGVAILVLKCGSGNDNAYVAPHPVTTIDVQLNGQAGRGTGDLAGFATAGTTSPQHFPSGPGAGTWTFADRALIFYSGAEEVAQDNVAPQVLSSSFELDLPRQAVRVAFSEDVSESLTGASIELMNLTSGQTIPPSNIAVSYDAALDRATFTFPGYPNGVLPDGNYHLLVRPQAVTDLFGNALAGEHTLEFFFLQGDANHDRRVNLQDFNRLAMNFGQAGRVFSQGDFNYDGEVNLQDFNRLAAAFGNVLDEPTARSSGGSLSPAPFSAVRIEDAVRTGHSRRLVDQLNETLA
jgi:hypothetical protein